MSESNLELIYLSMKTCFLAAFLIAVKAAEPELSSIPYNPNFSYDRLYSNNISNGPINIYNRYYGQQKNYYIDGTDTLAAFYEDTNLVG